MCHLVSGRSFNQCKNKISKHHDLKHFRQNLKKALNTRQLPLRNSCCENNISIQHKLHWSLLTLTTKTPHEPTKEYMTIPVLLSNVSSSKRTQYFWKLLIVSKQMSKN